MDRIEPLNVESAAVGVEEKKILRLEVAVRRVCEANNRRRSLASIRRSVGVPHEDFGVKQACMAFENLGFVSRFKECTLSELDEIVLPAIIFDKNSDPIVLIEYIQLREIEKQKKSRNLMRRLFLNYMQDLLLPRESFRNMKSLKNAATGFLERSGKVNGFISK